MSDLEAAETNVYFASTLSYESENILVVWKQAVVYLRYEGVDSRTSTENYRPISLTSTCCKIIELLISKFILKHMKVNNFLTPTQLRFLSKSSTLSA